MHGNLLQLGELGQVKTGSIFSTTRSVENRRWLLNRRVIGQMQVIPFFYSGQRNFVRFGGRMEGAGVEFSPCLENVPSTRQRLGDQVTVVSTLEPKYDPRTAAILHIQTEQLVSRQDVQRYRFHVLFSPPHPGSTYPTSPCTHCNCLGRQTVFKS